MKQLIISIAIFVGCYSAIFSQTYTEDNWTKFYIPIQEKIIGIWPNNSRYSDINRLKELKHVWGFNHILIANYHGLDVYDKIIFVGFDPNHIFREIKQDSYQADVESVPEMKYYYIDEPADEGENMTMWEIARDWIRNKYNSAEFVLSGYKRNDQLKAYVNSIGDHVMFSSYKHWWEFLGLWISWPEDPDQRPDWKDMEDLFGSKFSFSWVGAHKDEKEYDDLLGKAKNLGLRGVFLYQLEPYENEVGDDNLDKFSTAAVNHGFMNDFYQQVREYYQEGKIVKRKLMGPIYPGQIPQIYDHSKLIFENYTVTNNRIEDYFAEAEISAGSPFVFIIPPEKNATFNTNGSIKLKPGFHAERGSSFRASIGED